MSGIDDTTNTPPASNSGEYDTQECPLCEAEVKVLPFHFRSDCDETPD